MTKTATQTITLHWDTLHVLAREEILLTAGFQSRLAHYEWGELECWIQTDIQDSLKRRSKGTVAIDA